MAKRSRKTAENLEPQPSPSSLLRSGAPLGAAQSQLVNSCPVGQEAHLFIPGPDPAENCLTGPATFWETPCNVDDCPPGPETTVTTAGGSYNLSSRTGGACPELTPGRLTVDTATQCGFRFTLPALPPDASFLVLERALNPQGPWSSYHTPPGGLAGGTSFTTIDLEADTLYYFRVLGVLFGSGGAGPSVAISTLVCPANFAYVLRVEELLTETGNCGEKNYTQTLKSRVTFTPTAQGKKFPTTAIWQLQRAALVGDETPLEGAWATITSGTNWGSEVVFSENIAFQTHYWYRITSAVNSGATRVSSEPIHLETTNRTPQAPGGVQFDDTYGSYFTVVAPESLPEKTPSTGPAQFLQLQYKKRADTEWSYVTNPQTGQAIRFEAYDLETYDPSKGVGGWILQGLDFDTIYDCAFVAFSNNPCPSVITQFASNRTDKIDLVAPPARSYPAGSSSSSSSLNAIMGVTAVSCTCPASSTGSFTSLNSLPSSVSGVSSSSLASIDSLCPPPPLVTVRETCSLSVQLPFLTTEADFFLLEMSPWRPADATKGPQGPWSLYASESGELGGMETVVIPNLAPSKKYWFRVVGVSSLDICPSEPLLVETLPCAPQFDFNLAARAISDSQIQLDTTLKLLAPTPEQYPATVVVERATSATGPWTATVPGTSSSSRSSGVGFGWNSTSFTDNDLKANTLYWYRLAATSTPGLVTYSTPLCVRTPVESKLIENIAITFDDPDSRSHIVRAPAFQTPRDADYLLIGRRTPEQVFSDGRELPWDILVNPSSGLPVQVFPYNQGTYDPWTGNGAWLVDDVLPDTQYEYAFISAWNATAFKKVHDVARIWTNPEALSSVSSVSSQSSTASNQMQSSSSSLLALAECPVTWISPASGKIPASSVSSESSSNSLNTSTLLVENNIQAFSQDACFMDFHLGVEVSGATGRYSVSWSIYSNDGGLVLFDQMVGSPTLLSLPRGHNWRIISQVTDSLGFTGSAVTNLQAVGGGVGCTSSSHSMGSYASGASLLSLASVVGRSRYVPHPTPPGDSCAHSVIGRAGEACDCLPHSSLLSSLASRSSIASLSSAFEAGCRVTTTLVAQNDSYGLYEVLASPPVGAGPFNYAWKIRETGAALETYHANTSGFVISLPRGSFWSVELTTFEGSTGEEYLCSADIAVPAVAIPASSVSSQFSESSTSSSSSGAPFEGRVSLVFQATGAEAVWIEANGLRLSEPKLQANGLWFLLWDTRDFFNGPVTLRAYALDSEGNSCFDEIRAEVFNSPFYNTYYQDILSPVVVEPGYNWSNVHVGLDTYPLSPSMRRRFWVELFVTTDDIPDLFKTKPLDLAAIAAQTNEFQFVPLRRGPQDVNQTGHPHFSQLFGITALDSPGKQVRARFKLTPVEEVYGFTTGCREIRKMRVLPSGNIEVFGVGPARLFEYDGEKLELMSNGDLSLYDAADATDATLVDDKIYVVRNKSDGSAADEFFYIDATSGEADTVIIPRKETRPVRFVERMSNGTDVLMVLVDPARPAVRNSSSSSGSSGAYSGDGGQRTVAYVRTPTDVLGTVTEPFWRLDAAIEKIYAENPESQLLFSLSQGPNLWQATETEAPIFLKTFPANITAIDSLQVGLVDGRVFKYYRNNWFYDSTVVLSNNQKPVTALGSWKGATDVMRSVAGNASTLYAQGLDLSWGPDIKLEEPPILISHPKISGSSRSSVSSSTLLDISQITVIETLNIKAVAADVNKKLPAVEAKEQLLIGTAQDGIFYVVARSRLSEATGAIQVSEWGNVNVFPYAMQKAPVSSSSRSSRSSSLTSFVFPNPQGSSSLVSSSGSLAPISSISGVSRSSSSRSSVSTSSGGRGVSSSSSSLRVYDIALGHTGIFPTYVSSGSTLFGEWEIRNPFGTIYNSVDPGPWQVDIYQEFASISVPLDAPVLVGYIFRKAEGPLDENGFTTKWSKQAFNTVSAPTSSVSAVSISSSSSDSPSAPVLMMGSSVTLATTPSSAGVSGGAWEIEDIDSGMLLTNFVPGEFGVTLTSTGAVVTLRNVAGWEGFYLLRKQTANGWQAATFEARRSPDSSESSEESFGSESSRYSPIYVPSSSLSSNLGPEDVLWEVYYAGEKIASGDTASGPPVGGDEDYVYAEDWAVRREGSSIKLSVPRDAPIPTFDAGAFYQVLFQDVSGVYSSLVYVNRYYVPVMPGGQTTQNLVVDAPWVWSMASNWRIYNVAGNYYIEDTNLNWQVIGSTTEQGPVQIFVPASGPALNGKYIVFQRVNDQRTVTWINVGSSSSSLSSLRSSKSSVSRSSTSLVISSSQSLQRSSTVSRSSSISFKVSSSNSSRSSSNSQSSVFLPQMMTTVSVGSAGAAPDDSTPGEWVITQGSPYESVGFSTSDVVATSQDPNGWAVTVLTGTPEIPETLEVTAPGTADFGSFVVSWAGYPNMFEGLLLLQSNPSSSSSSILSLLSSNSSFFSPLSSSSNSTASRLSSSSGSTAPVLFSSSSSSKNSESSRSSSSSSQQFLMSSSGTSQNSSSTFLVSSSSDSLSSSSSEFLSSSFSGNSSSSSSVEMVQNIEQGQILDLVPTSARCPLTSSSSISDSSFSSNSDFSLSSDSSVSSLSSDSSGVSSSSSSVYIEPTWQILQGGTVVAEKLRSSMSSSMSSSSLSSGTQATLWSVTLVNGLLRVAAPLSAPIPTFDAGASYEVRYLDSTGCYSALLYVTRYYVTVTKNSLPTLQVKEDGTWGWSMASNWRIYNVNGAYYIESDDFYWDVTGSNAVTGPIQVTVPTNATLNGKYIVFKRVAGQRTAAWIKVVGVTSSSGTSSSQSGPYTITRGTSKALTVTKSGTYGNEAWRIRSGTTNYATPSSANGWIVTRTGGTTNVPTQITVFVPLGASTLPAYRIDWRGTGRSDNDPDAPTTTYDRYTVNFTVVDPVSSSSISSSSSVL